MSNDYKATVRGLINEVFNEGNLDAVDNYIHDDFVEHEAGPPGMPTDKEAPRAWTAMMRAAFPDMHMAIEDLVVEGDKVAIRTTVTGTHTGEFMGIPPTDKKFEISAIDIVRMQDGKLIEHWGVSDAMAMMQQLGVMSEDPTAG